jgi:hypothetical protein
MGELPRVLALFWVAMIAASAIELFWLTQPAASADAWGHVQLFAGWQGTALIIAIVAVAFSRQRRDPPRSTLWWLSWGPLYGSLGIILIVLAALTAGTYAAG